MPGKGEPAKGCFRKQGWRALAGLKKQVFGRLDEDRGLQPGLSWIVPLGLKTPDLGMKIVLVHNRYQKPGGEDQVFAQELRLLESREHRVITYQRSNNEALTDTPVQRLLQAKRLIWAEDTKREMHDLLRREKPDVVHVHNTFFQISPSIFAACRDAGVPVVQTLHNFRLLCPGATFFRDGRVCEDCRVTNLLQSIRHACYHDSYGSTAALALMLEVHRKAGTWLDKVNTYIALTDFAKKKFVQGGLPAEKMRVKPNFVSPDPGGKDTPGEGAVFVGRLSPEKGVGTLLRAWKLLPVPMPLRIFGDGPMRGELQQLANELNLSGVTFMGQVNGDAARSAIKNARLLMMPSECYENFPLTIVEAFSCGTPIICSRLGAMQEIVADGDTGLHFIPGNAEDLAQRAAWAWDHPAQISEMGKAGRREYEQKYTAEANHAHLMSIYHQAIAARN